MIKRIKTFLSNLERAQPKFDSSFVNDELADQVDWTPINSGGASFRTRKLVQINPSRIEFTPSTGMKLFLAAFCIPAIVMLAIFILLDPFGEDDVVANLAFIIIPVLFLGASALMYNYVSKPTVFDKRAGFFWQGWKSPQYRLDHTRVKKSAKLKSIYALQVISEYVSSDKSGYTSYELNVVLKDLTRINVIDHGNYERLIEDAELLADFLIIPIWDGSKKRVRPRPTSNEIDMY